MSLIQAANPLEVCTNEDTASTKVDAKSGSSAIWCFLLSIPGVPLLLLFMLAGADHVSDFTGFLVGAKLLGTAHIYDVAANLAQQRAFVGDANPGVIFVRLPFWAFAMKPFLHLTYDQALFLWRLIIGAILITSAAISGRDRRFFFLALCWSVAAAGCLHSGNDSPLILLFMLISLIFWRRGQHLLAGVALGLCLAKFHFLIFLPLLLFRKESRRELIGFLLSAAALTSVNFAVQPHWIRLYWQALQLPQRNMNARAAYMPNFYSAFFWTGHAGLAVALGALIVMALIWPICRRMPFDFALPFCIFAGMIAAPHTNYLDGVLAIPAILAASSRFPQVRPFAIFLLSPVVGLISYLGPPTIGPAIILSASLALLACTLRLTALSRKPSAAIVFSK
jgi:hypothetical protein